MSDNVKKFSHPTNYKGIILRVGERHYLARGKNRGVAAALKMQRRIDAQERMSK